MIYAQHASAEFNAGLHKELIDLTQAVRAESEDNLIALVLGGGYGRGEGGVVCENGYEYPYNDLDFTIVVSRKEPSMAKKLSTLSEPFAKRLRIEIDYSRPLTIADIRNWPHWMMWHDLLLGHQVLYGPEDILTANAPEAVRAPLPLVEGTRLLLNRGAGLLWAMRVAVGLDESPDADFTRRNYYKCLLALGDALLVAAGKYTTRYTGRDRLLADALASTQEFSAIDVLPQYQAALRFKFQPDHLPGAQQSLTQLRDLVPLWGQVWLAVERQRTGRTWPGVDEYCAWGGLREPEEHRGANWLRNVAVNARRGHISPYYPREMLYRQLPTLLESADAADWAEKTQQFLAIWRRFN